MASKHINMTSTQKLPRKQGLKYKPEVAAKRFHSVEQYLSWVMNADPDVSQQKRGGKTPDLELICCVLACVFEVACKESPDFEKNFDLDEVFACKTRVLAKIKENEYNLRLKLREPGVKDAFQMLVGHVKDVPKGKALLQLNQDVPIEEKLAMTRWMQQSMDGNYISPVKLANWACPVLTKAIKSVNKRVIEDYEIRTIIMQSKNGLEVVISCENPDSNKAFSVKLLIDVCVSVTRLPNQFKLHCFKKKARDLLSNIRYNNFQVYLHAPMVEKPLLPGWYTNGSLLQLSQKQRNKKMLEIPGNVQVGATGGLSSRDITAVIGGGKPTDELFWDIDYFAIEKDIHSKIKLESSYLLIKDAFQLYNMLVNHGDKIVPELNKNTRQALSLFLYEETLHKPGIKFKAMLQKLLFYVKGCVACRYCPYFCQPHVNTMDSSEDVDTEGKQGGLPLNVAQADSITKLLKLIKKGDISKTIEFINIY